MASLRLSRAVLSTFAAGALVLAAVTIALVVSPGTAGAVATATIDLKDAHEGTTAEDFDPNDTCTGPFDDLNSDEDGWHFVLDGSNDFTQVRLVFNPGSVNVTIDKTLAQGGNSGPGWFGYLDNAGGSMKHAYLITDAGWTLVSGQADISYTGNKPDDFQLSHTCAGTPTSTTTTTKTTTTTATTTTTTKTTTTTTTTGSTPTPGTTTTDDGDLPVTGAGLGGLIAAGLILTAGGAALLFARRRRDAEDATPDGGPIG
jgi:LPXTG-motif cell wall-anchored protein